MRYYWLLTLLLLMMGVGMSLDPREVVSRWVRLPRSYWLRVFAATFLLPPLLAMLLVGTLSLKGTLAASILLMSVAPGAPMLTRMVSKSGGDFDNRLAASYQIGVGLLIPLLTPCLVYLLGSHYHRVVWISPWTLAWQVASMQFLPLVAGLCIRHYLPAFADKASPWMSRFGNLLLLAYLLLILFGLRRVLLAVGPMAAGTAFAFAVGCMLIGHLLGGPTIALCNSNRHVGLALLVAGVNFHENLRAMIPFFAAYALLAPLIMVGYSRLYSLRKGPSTVPPATTACP